jgi:hypothetical protein
MTGLDEPFELFKGFNEIFIVVGLTILYLGFAGITGMTLFGTESGYILGVVYALIGMGGVIALARYFTLKRRMVAPSIALAIMFGFLAGQLGISVSAMFDLKAPQTLTATAATAALFLSAYYLWFRVPFTVALVALSVFATVFGLATLGGSFPETPTDIFLLTADGPFAILTFVLGLIDRFQPPRNRLRTRPLHRRPEGRQARRRHRAAQPLAAPAAGRTCAKRSAERTS